MASVNIFQIRSDVSDPDEIIEDRGSLWSRDVRIDGRLFGVLYVRRSKPRKPRWLPYFEKLVDFAGAGALTASAAAALLVKRKTRLYAVTFGYGRSLLADGAVEERFGLKATLNAIEPTQIRSIDHRRLEAVSRHTREQVSKASGLQYFGLDIERDLLRAVTGTPSDPTLGTRIAGADQLSVAGDIPIGMLGDLIDRYEGLAEEKKYQENFPWVDNIAEVTDPYLRHALDDSLVKRLKGGGLEKTWVAPPEIIDWADVAGFRYRSAANAPTFDDLELEDYFRDCRPKKDITPDWLRTDHVRCVSALDGQDRFSWPVYRCLVAELQTKSGTYVLSEAKWYRVDTAFLAVVDSSIAALPHLKAPLPDYKGDKDEEAYNERVAKGSVGYFALMDRKLIRSVGKGKVEVCDLYSKDRQLIHVKRYGSSSVLSHLFSQGTVSAQLLLFDKTFRQEMNQVLPPSHRLPDPADSIIASEFEVAYAVVARRGKSLDLPFFSKVNLRNAVQLLTQFGYHVSLTAITAQKSQQKASGTL